MTKAKEIIFDRIDNAAFLYDSYLGESEDNPETKARRTEWDGILIELMKISDAFGFGEEATDYVIERKDYYKKLRLDLARYAKN